ncbi:MAG: hypothetical protein LUI87_07485 [Lachnospiraceae bacterium]|nr:hypothetical protein [Lachnospiraceae bacterium]
MRAAVYVRIYEADSPFTGYEAMRERLLLHCKIKGYQPTMVLGIRGTDPYLEDAGRKKLYQLAELGLVDVIVMPDLHTISDSIEETEFFLRRILRSTVRVELLENTHEESELYKQYVRLLRERKSTVRTRGWLYLLKKKWKGGNGSYADQRRITPDARDDI